MHNQISESHSDQFLYYLPSFNHLDCLQTLFNAQKRLLHQAVLIQSHTEKLYTNWSYFTDNYQVIILENLTCISLYMYWIYSLNLGHRVFFSVFHQCKWLFHSWIFSSALCSYHLISPEPRLGLSCCIRSLQWVLTRLPLILQGLLKCHNHLDEKAIPCWVPLTTNYL